MKHLLDLVINANHTNIILMSAPHRFDLMETSCVNLEIKNFNSKLRTKLERIGKVKLIEVDNDRTLYTGHGQHLNARGKESMAKKIASMIKRMLAKETKPIRAKWYLDKETPETTPPTTNDQDSTAPINKDPEIENEQTGTQNPEKPETTLQSLSSLSWKNQVENPRTKLHQPPKKKMTR